jgi:hypothetical protein
MRTCADCGTELRDLTAPCPACGSTRQSVAAQAQVPVAIATAVKASVGYGADRPWYAQWHNVREHLQTVDDECRPGAYRGNLPVKRAFENFFTQCFHLGDWLWGDKTTGLTEKQVRDFILKDPALRVCAGIANTSKHRTRNQPGAMTARIAEVTPDEKGTRAAVDWSQSPNSGTEDAFDLARRCVVAWDSYLKAIGLQSPI